MTDKLIMEVGGVRFHQRSGPPPAPLPASYREFLRPAVEDSLVLEIGLEIIAPSDICDPGPRVFTTGAGWSMAEDGGDRVVVLDPPATGGRVWCTARFPSGAERLVVTVDEPSNIRLGYPLDQIILMYRLLGSPGVILHGAGFGFGGRGYAFLGPSGAGKTTLASILRGAGWSTLSDDRLIVRKMDGIHRLFGTPWPGEGMYAVNAHLPLAGIFLLRHGPENGLRELAPAMALHRILGVASIPWFDREALPAALDACGEIVEGVPVHEFTFRPDAGAVDFLSALLTA